MGAVEDYFDFNLRKGGVWDVEECGRRLVVLEGNCRVSNKRVVDGSREDWCWYGNNWSCCDQRNNPGLKPKHGGLE